MDVYSPKSFGKLFDLIVATLLVLAIPYLSSVFADLVYPRIKKFDPDETYVWVSAHHIAQLLLTLAIMVWLWRGSLKNWGFNLKNMKLSLIFILGFLLFFGSYKFFQIRTLAPIDYPYPLTATNIWGVQGFQYLLSGAGEEPLFRGLIMTYLATGWSKVYKPFGIEFPQTILIATALFMVAHLNIDFLNFSISGFDASQQMKSLQLGIFYGLMFHHTKSLLAPIVVHGLSNGLLFTFGFNLS